MKKKSALYDADQFISAEPMAQWPDGVIINENSSTGYSYGSLNMVPAPIGDGSVTQDGFEIASGQWIIKQSDSVVFLANNDTVEQYLEEDL